jgi:hypothetical protein
MKAFAEHSASLMMTPRLQAPDDKPAPRFDWGVKSRALRRFARSGPIHGMWAGRLCFTPERF